MSLRDDAVESLRTAAKSRAMPLLVVPTPLGNLGDVTSRALDALRNAELVVAEDTRVARKLLSALGVGSKRLISYREQNARVVTRRILAHARNERVVLVSDAGMPGISDPGSDLIAAARAAGIAIDVLPGPSAVLGLAVLSGFSLRRFAFEGFPPRSSAARRRAFEGAQRQGVTSLWFESPARIRAALRDLEAVAPQAHVFLVREYTKRHEQQLLGDPATVARALPDPVRGEIAFAIAPPAERTSQPPGAREIDDRIDAMLRTGRGTAEIARMLAASGCGDRRELYARAVARRRTGKARHASTEGKP